MRATRFRGLMVPVLVVIAACTATVLPSFAAAAPQGARAGELHGYQRIGERGYALAGSRSVYTITYTSRGPRGTQVPVKATVWLPSVSAPTGGYPVAAYAHGTVGLGDDCTQASAFEPDGSAYEPYMSPLLKKGFILVATEYAGIDGPGVHPYLDGRVSGANVIDSVRAVRQLGTRLGVPVDSRYLTYGGSQGGHASLSAGTLHRAYAPELTLLGTAAVAPPVYIDRYLSLLGPQIPAVPVPDYVTYLSYVLRGLAVARPDVNVASYLTPLGKQLFRAAETLCYPDMVKRTRGVGVGQILSRPLGDGPLMKAVRDVQVVPTGSFDAPVQIHQGVFDVTAFAPLTEQYVSDARAAGAQIDYRRGVSGHAVGPAAVSQIAGWAQQRLLASR